MPGDGRRMVVDRIEHTIVIKLPTMARGGGVASIMAPIDVDIDIRVEPTDLGAQGVELAVEDSLRSVHGAAARRTLSGVRGVEERIHGSDVVLRRIRRRQAQRRVHDESMRAEVVQRRVADALADRAALRVVRVEQAVEAMRTVQCLPVSDGEIQLPHQIVCVLNARVQPQGAPRRDPVRRVAHEKHAPRPALASVPRRAHRVDVPVARGEQLGL